MLARRGTGGARRLPLLLAGLAALACGGGDGDGERAAPPAAVGGAVSAATPEATAAGVRVLALGGNAVDAAVAAALVLGVTEPSESGLGGHAVMLLAPPGGEAVVLHSPETAPLRSSAERPALAPPSALAVLGQAWQRYGSGTLPWEDLVEPAIRVAEEGWALGRFRHRITIQEYTRLLGDSLTRSLLLNPDNSIPTEGSHVANPALAATLRVVADEGPAALAGGALAAALAEVLEAHGYGGAEAWLGRPAAVTASAPAAGSYRGRTVLTAPEPFGGPAVLRALAFLESAPRGVLQDDGLPRTVWMAEALGWARSPGADPATFLAELPPLPLPAEDSALVADSSLLGGDRGAPPHPAALDTGGAPSPRAAVDTVAASPAPPRPSRGGPSSAGDQTTHLSVVDGRGMAVSLTLSLGRPYGAGFVAGELGFFPGVAPGAVVPEPSGVPAPPPAPDTATGGAGADVAGPSDAADDEPGSDTRWWAAPTILLRDGRPELVLGSPGGSRGVSAVVQVVASWIAGAGTLAEVIDAPRIHVTPDSASRHRLVLEGVVWMDSARSTPRVLEPFGDTVLRATVAERGIIFGEHDAGPFFQDWDPWFGGVHAVARTEEGWMAAADPRRDGEGRVVGPEDVVEATGEAPPADSAPLSPGGEAAPSPPDPGG